MIKQNRCALIVFFILLPFAFALGQNKELIFHFFGGVSSPTGNFGKKIGSTAMITRRAGFDYGGNVGLASTGFVVGAEITRPVLVEGLGWQISSKIIYNPTNKSSVENEFGADPRVKGALEFETGNWINIPVFSGFSYGIKLFNRLNVYYHIQAGLNFTRQASRKATLNGSVIENTRFRTMTNYGFETGIGFDFMETYSLSVRYLDLGTPRHEGNRTLNESFFTEIVKRESHIIGEEKSVTLFLITLGIKI